MVANKIVSLLLDNAQHLWIGTSQGISRFSNGSFVNYSHEDSNGLVGGTINCIYQTIEGTMWFGTFGGVIKHDNTSMTNFSTQDGLVTNKISAGCIDEDNRLWLTSALGLTTYDGKKFHAFKTNNNLVNRANRIELGKDGRIWFGLMSYTQTPYDGLASFDGNNVQHYSVDDGLIGNTVSAIHVDPDGILWVGSTGRAKAEGSAGLSKFDGRNFTAFSMKSIVGDFFERDAVRAIISDTYGRIWLGRNEGLSCFDGTKFLNFHQENGLVNNEVRSLLVDRNNILWVGTYFGISRWDLKENISDVRFQTYTTEDGLSYPEILGGIYHSSDDLIWLGTSGGVSIFDGITWSSLDIRDGLSNNFIRIIGEDRNRNMWFVVGDQGVSRYRRSEIKPIVKIISLQLGAETYTTKKSKGIHQITSGRRLTVNYSAIDYLTHPIKRQYRYRMKGHSLDENWNRQTTETHFDYVFKKPGKYTFEVQAINRDLRYSDPKNISFNVLPAWYMNGWILIPTSSLIVVIMVLALVYGIRYYQQRRESELLELEAKKLQAQMLEQERETRLALEAELTDANQMQTSLLPKTAPVVEGLQIAGSSIATREVGGDFFDYLISENGRQISIAVGDVSGKGLRGAMNAVMASGILRIYAEQENNISSVMSNINKALCQNMEQDMNVTMVLAQFDTEEKLMTLANAGQHAYPLLIRGGFVQSVKAKGLALGMIPTIPYKSIVVDLESGDLLLLMTDGITEPRNADGVMYEESGRLAELVSSIPADMSIKEVVDTIINDVEAYTADEEQDDDITLVAVRVS